MVRRKKKTLWPLRSAGEESVEKIQSRGLSQQLSGDIKG